MQKSIQNSAKGEMFTGALNTTGGRVGKGVVLFKILNKTSLAALWGVYSLMATYPLLLSSSPHRGRLAASYAAFNSRDTVDLRHSPPLNVG